MEQSVKGAPVTCGVVMEMIRVGGEGWWRRKERERQRKTSSRQLTDRVERRSKERRKRGMMDGE